MEGEIIDDYLSQMDRMLAVGLEGEPKLDRRSILGSVTKMIYPTGSMPDYIEPIPLTGTLEYVYALHENDMALAQPLSKLTQHVAQEKLDLTAHAKLKAYARGVSVIREMGGVILEGRKQTPSIAFCIDVCAKMLKLPKCRDGWFVAVPARSMVVIIPATNASMLVPLVELGTSIHVQAPDPLSPWVYYVNDGTFQEILGPGGVDVPSELLALHGPFEDWPVQEGYWEGNYAGGL